MAEEDKTYCGQNDHNSGAGETLTVGNLATKLSVSIQDVLDAMEQVGPDFNKVEAYFKSKENSY